MSSVSKGRKTNSPAQKGPSPAIQKADNNPLNKEIPVAAATIKNNFGESIGSSKAIFIAKIVVAGFFLSVVYHFCLSVKGMEYPYNTFLFNPEDRFKDFFDVYKPAVGLHPYTYEYSVNYFPLTFLIMYFFTLLPADLAILLFSASFIVFFVIYLYNNLPFEKTLHKIIAVVVFSFMSYPFLFVVDRGNIEAWLFIALALFMYFYVKKKYILSVLFLSVAISLKLFPAVLCLLFILDRKYLLVVYTAVMTALYSLLSAALFEGGIVQSIKGLTNGLLHFNKKYNMCARSENLQHNTSIMVPLKLMYYNYLTRLPTIIPGYEQKFSRYYFIFVISFFLIILFFIFRYQFSLWKKVALIVFVFVLLPQVSYDYRLINIFIPLILFINEKDNSSKFNVLYSVLFGLLLIPKDYFIIVDDLSISSIINPLIIVTMIVLIIMEAIKSGAKMKYSFMSPVSRGEKSTI